MKKIVLFILLLVLLLSACSRTSVISQTVVSKSTETVGDGVAYHITVNECTVTGTRLNPCSEKTYDVTKESYEINIVGEGYKKP